MKQCGLSLFLGFFSLFAWACTHATPAPQQASGKAPIFLWKVSSPAAVNPQPLYLYGTVHINDATHGQLDKAVIQRFASAQVLVLEVEPGEEQRQEFRQQLLNLGVLPNGQSLSEHVSKETWQELNAFLNAQGISKAQKEALFRMRPWLASLTLLYSTMQRAGASREFGSEEQLTALAFAQKKAIRGLEKATFQLQLMADGDAKEQEFQLRQALEELRAFTGQSEERDDAHLLFDAYRLGDLEQLNLYAKKLAEDPESQGFYQKFLVQRNQGMLQQLKQMLSEPSLTFVAVGALHLAGPVGLLQSLKDQGYQLERISAEGAVQELYLPD